LYLESVYGASPGLYLDDLAEVDLLLVTAPHIGLDLLLV